MHQEIESHVLEYFADGKAHGSDEVVGFLFELFDYKPSHVMLTVLRLRSEGYLVRTTHRKLTLAR